MQENIFLELSVQKKILENFLKMKKLSKKQEIEIKPIYLQPLIITKSQEL